MERESPFNPGIASEPRRARIDRAMSGLEEHPLVERYQPQLLGEGAMYSVFTVEGKNRSGKEHNSVIKVRRGYLQDVLDGMLNPGLDETAVEASEYQLARLEKAKSSEQESIRLFERHFAPYVLKERVMIMDVPVTDEMLEAVSPEGKKYIALPPGVHEAPTLVTIQEKAPEAAFAKGVSRGLQTDVFEDRSTVLDRSYPELYDAVNEAFVDGAEKPNLAYGLKLLAHGEDTRQLTADMQTDEELRTLLRGFVASAINYSQETGGYLDCIGANNLRLFKDDGHWKLLLIDARTNGAWMGKGKNALKKMLAGQTMEPNEIKVAELTLNYTRFLNALAAEVDMTDRLKISDQPLAGRGEELMNYFEQIAPKKASASNEVMAAK